jgi:hypothetical protein
VPVLDNPAGRLLNYLVALQNTANPQAITTRDAWAGMLGATDDASFFELYAQVVKLPDQIEVQVRATIHDPKHAEELMTELPALKSLLTDVSALTHTTAQTQHRINGSQITQLRSINAVLSSFSQAKGSPTVGQLQEIEQEIASLLAEVTSATDIEDDVRHFLTRHLTDMLRVVSDYRITGPEPLERVLNETIGDYAVRSSHPSAQPAGRFTKEFWKIVGRAAVVVTIVYNSYALVANVDYTVPQAEVPSVIFQLPGPRALPPGNPTVEANASHVPLEPPPHGSP